ncbi:cytidine deaminase [Mycoplasmopsis pulmonis]|nr:cytidine deaminase [Mycoplasmopsis pulmonis]MDZ7293333.1 cytidine deaminase [Mycoplasmopsis pulmonis]
MNEIYNELKTLLEKSYSPYSKFKVASIVLDKGGKKFKGVNVENAAYPSGICAERSALFGAISHGFKPGSIDKIYIFSSSNEPIAPCLGCRQVMTELMDENALVILISNDGKKIVERKLEEFCPYPVKAKDIK